VTLSAIFEQIDTVEKTEKRLRLNVRKTEYDLEFILLGFVLIVLDFFVRKGLLREVL
jgi:hypothetical protein